MLNRTDESLLGSSLETVRKIQTYTKQKGNKKILTDAEQSDADGCLSRMPRTMAAEIEKEIENAGIKTRD